ncbi:MAG: hypothetical protein F6J87_12240 [Spirulina sp. SIO3F2]|nr:hypothetical protein [Spirulina sp. SIO3F2]
MAQAVQAATTNQLKLAKQGHPDAIAALINRSLRTKKINVQVSRNADCLVLMLRADVLPAPAKLVPWLERNLSALKIPSLQQVQIIGWQTHAKLPVWTQEITTRAGKPISTDPKHSPENGVPPQTPCRIEANIQARDVPGQVTVGHNNTIVGENGSLVINQLPANQKPTITPIAVGDDFKPPKFPHLLDRLNASQQIKEILQASQNVECYGSQGLGKTALLRFSAHRDDITPLFPDGIIYLSARNKSVDDLLQSLFEAFYETDIPFKPATEMHFRRMLRNKKSLVLLDNINGSQIDIEYLLSCAPDIKFLLASQQQNLSESDATALPLSGLPMPDAIALFERSLERSLQPIEQKAVRELCAHLKGHPLQIKQIASLIRHQKIAVLDKVKHVLATQSPEQVTVETAKELLDSAQQALPVLGLLAGVPLPANALAEISGTTNINATLALLEDLSWLSTNGTQYCLAENLVTPLKQIWDWSGCLPRLVNHITRWSERYAQNSTEILECADAVLQTLKLAAEAGQWSEVLYLSQLFDKPLWLSRQWGMWEQVLQWQLQAAQVIGNPTATALALHQLGTRSLCLDDSLSANAYLHQALELREAIGDNVGASITRHNLGLLLGDIEPIAESVSDVITPTPPSPSPWPRLALVAMPILIGAIVGGYVTLQNINISTPTSNGSPNPEPSPSPSPELSPSPNPKPTPSPSPEPSPSPNPKPTPSPSPKPTPSPSPKPTPSPSPEPSPSPSPEPSPSPNPKPTPSPSPEPSPFPNPEPSPSPSPEPTTILPPNVSPTNIDFEDDTKTPRTITIRLDGRGESTIGKVDVVGEYPKAFKIIDDQCSGKTLRSQQNSCVIQVQYIAGYPTTRIEAQLLIPNNSSSNPKVVDLAGSNLI